MGDCIPGNRSPFLQGFLGAGRGCVVRTAPGPLVRATWAPGAKCPDRPCSVGTLGWVTHPEGLWPWPGVGALSSCTWVTGGPQGST